MDNAHYFTPKRLLGSNFDFKGKNFELIPFGAGWKIYPGLPLAIKMLYIMLGPVINSFDWKLEDKNMDMKKKMAQPHKRPVAT